MQVQDQIGDRILHQSTHTDVCANCAQIGAHRGAAKRGEGRAARSTLAAYGEGWGEPHTGRTRP